MKKLSIVVVSTLVAALMGFGSGGGLKAEGTESLGPAGIGLAEGTGIVGGGVGMFSQPAALNVNVPAGVSVEQVLLYWAGQSFAPDTGDATIVVEGTEVAGDRVGGPAFFFRRNGIDVRTTSFRADITDLGLVGPGLNVLSMSGLAYDVANNGAGVLVIYDDGTGAATIDVRDGMDLAYANFPEPRQTTAAQTFSFPPAEFDRVVNLVLFVASVGSTSRPSAIDVTSNGITVRDTSFLHDSDGAEWDTVNLPILLRANSTEVTVQPLSIVDGVNNPASLEWVGAALSVPPNCRIDPNALDASGRSFGIQADVFGGTFVQPAEPDTDVTNPGMLLNVDVGGIVVDPLLSVVETTDIDALGALDVAIATASDLTIDVPGVLRVEAASVVARAESSASGTTANSSREGSRVQDLVVNGTEIGDVVQPTTFVVNDPTTGLRLGEVRVLETIRSGAAAGVPQPEGTSLAGQVFGSGIAVNALHVILDDISLTPLNEATDIIVSHADSRASFPSALECGSMPQVRGSAYLANVDEVVAGVGTLSVGQVNLPITGGLDTATAADLSGNGIIAGQTRTEGEIGTPLRAASRATATDVDILAGLVDATLVESTSETVAGVATGTATIADLVIAGVNVCNELGLHPTCTPPPNTVRYLDTEAILVLNEQLPEPNGLTVNAVHLYVVGEHNSFGLPVGADIILSSSTSGTG